MTVIAIDHIQIAIPEGKEELARSFYGGVLGLPEVDKPENLTNRGGVWFERGTLKVHLGIDPDFTPAKKAHPGFLVADLSSLSERLRSEGYDVNSGSQLPRFRRAFTNDPFGNRIELLQATTTFEAKYKDLCTEKSVLMIQLADQSQVQEICDVLIRSIDKLCYADHQNSQEILNKWLKNKNEESVKKWISDPSAKLFVALENDEVRGVGQINEKGHILLCYVAPEASGQGIGQSLLNAMESRAVSLGLKRITLVSTTTAKKFYERNGYELTSTSNVFGKMTSYHMTKSI